MVTQQTRLCAPSPTEHVPALGLSQRSWQGCLLQALCQPNPSRERPPSVPRGRAGKEGRAQHQAGLGPLSPWVGRCGWRPRCPSSPPRQAPPEARPGPCLAEAAVSAQAASRNLLPAAAPSSRGPAQPEQQACGGARVRAGWSQQRACPALGPATPSLEDAQLAEAKGTRGPQQLFPGIPWAGPQSPRNGLVAQSPSQDYKSGAPGSLGPAISLQPTSTPGPTERASLTQASRAREAPNCWPSPGDPSCTGRCWS